MPVFHYLRDEEVAAAYVYRDVSAPGKRRPLNANSAIKIA
jgi:hypothetical protein